MHLTHPLFFSLSLSLSLSLPGPKWSLLRLLRAGVLRPGKGVFSVFYKGVTFTADLLADGTVFFPKLGEYYSSPSSFR